MKRKIHTIMANSHTAVGIHEGSLTKHTKLGDLKAHTLICFDGDANYVKTCGINDVPWGICQQDADEKESIVSIQPLSSCAKTAQLRLNSDVQAGQFICLDDNGKVKALPTTAGIYNVVGIALNTGKNNECIEALTSLPHNIEIK